MLAFILEQLNPDDRFSIIGFITARWCLPRNAAG